jgi:hypothetical protein
MRTLVGHPEPPRGTVYVTATLNATLADIRFATPIPVDSTTAVSIARGWVSLDR